jgi:hypothetical protein
MNARPSPSLFSLFSVLPGMARRYILASKLGQRITMDKTNEVPTDGQTEYVAPTIVDYGDLVELTAVLNNTRITDVPQGSLEQTS